MTLENAASTDSKLLFNNASGMNAPQNLPQILNEEHKIYYSKHNRKPLF